MYTPKRNITKEKESMSTSKEAIRRNTESKCCDPKHKEIVAFCEQCSEYICQECLITDHIEHEDQLQDLEQECTKVLKHCQELLHRSRLILDRRQRHITEEDMPGIIAELKMKINRAHDDLIKHVEETRERALGVIEEVPVVKEYIRQKAVYEDVDHDPILPVRDLLDQRVKDLIEGLVKKEFMPILELLDDPKIRETEQTLDEYREKGAEELSYIRELKKFKEVSVETKYNKENIDAMVHIRESIKRPERVIFFGNESKKQINVVNIGDMAMSNLELNVDIELPQCFGTADLNGVLYITGGEFCDPVEEVKEDVQKYTSKCYVLDEFRLVLKPIAPLQVSRSRHSICADPLRKCFYVLGGENDMGMLSDVEKYEPEIDKWTYISPLTEKKCMVAPAIYGKFLYSIGGWCNDSLKTVERLNLDLPDAKFDAIKTTGHPPMGLSMSGIGRIGESKFILFGGYRKEAPLDETWSLDIAHGHKWEKKKEVLPKADAFIASEVKVVSKGGKDNMVIAFGYETRLVLCYHIKDAVWTAPLTAV